MKTTTLRNLLVLTALSASTGARADLKLSPGAVGPAVSAVSSTFAVIDDAKNQVQLFNSTADAAPFTTVDVAANPRSIVSKPFGDQSFFIATCEAAGNLYVIDDRGQLRATIAIKDGVAGSLAADPRPGSPYVYYSAGGERNLDDSRTLGRINLKTMKDEGWLEVQTNRAAGGAQRMMIDLSSDGRSIYGWRQSTSPTGVFRFDITESTDPAKPAVIKLGTYGHDTWRGLVPDTAGRFVAAEKQIRSADTTKVIGTLDGTAECVLRNKAVMFMRINEQIIALSSNDFRRLGGLLVSDYLPPDPKRKTPRPMLNEFPYDNGRKIVSMVADEVGGKLLVRGKSTLLSVPLADFKLPDEPVIAANVAGDRTLGVGIAWKAAVNRSNKDVKLTLGTAPAGLTLDGDTLAWTPGDDQIGPQRVEVIAGWQNTKVTQAIDLNVARPSVALGFKPRVMQLSPDGKLAVCFADEADPRLGRRNNGQEQPPSRIAVIDTKTLKIVADRSFTTAFRGVTTDGTRVFAVLRDAPGLQVLSAKDLSDEKQLFLAQQSSGETGIVGNYFYSRGIDGRRAELFDRRTLEAVSLDKTAPSPFDAVSGFTPTAKGFLYGGVEYSGDDLKPIRLAAFGPMAQFGGGGAVFDQNANDPNARHPFRFGARATMGQLVRDSMPPVQGAGDSNGVGVVLTDAPCWATLALDNEINNRGATPPRDRAVLALRNLTTGDVAKRVVLQDEPRDQQDYGGSRQGLLMDAGPGVLAAVVIDRLFALPTADIAKLPLARPLLVAGKTLPMILNGPGQIEWAVDGNDGAVRCQLETPIAGVTVAADKPAVSIDPAAAVEAAAQTVFNNMMNGGFGGSRASGAAVLDSYAVRERARLKSLLGVDIAGIPVGLTVAVRVADSQNKFVVARHPVVLDVPAAAFAKQVASFDSQMKAQQEQQQAMMARNGNAADAHLQRRVIELERDVAALRAKVDLLTDLVRGNNPAPAKRQAGQ